MTHRMPRWVERLGRRVGALRHAEALDRELDDELRLHLELETQDLIGTRGLPPAEARRQALLALGGVAQIREAHRDARGVRWVQELGQDLRYAARGLAQNPGFSLSAVLVLAIGIGAATAAFSAVKTVLLDPDYDHLVRVYNQDSPSNIWTLSTVDYRAIEAQQRSFSAVGALLSREVAVSAGGETQLAQTGWGTAGFFRALRVGAARGRSIEAADEVPGSPPVALISHRYAARLYGGDSGAIGRSLTIDGTVHTVVGVLPAGIDELAGRRAELWPALQLRPPERRGPFGLMVVGRLKDSVTVESAARDLAAISERIFPEWLSSFQDRNDRFTPYPLRTAVLGEAGRMLRIFAAAVALVLLIAVANVANLMLVRVSGRGPEIALRTVLGATRGRLIRLLVTESVLLALIGAVAGLLFGALALRALVLIQPALPRLAQARVGLEAVGWAGGLALLAGVVIGAYPVLLLVRHGSAQDLRAAGRTVGASRGTQGLRSAFVVAEFALSLPLLAGAGLLLNSFLRLSRVDPGFDPTHLLSLQVALPSARYPGDSAIAGFWTRALPRIRQIPGVIEAGLGSSMPPDNGGDVNNFDLVDRPVPAGSTQPTAPWPGVTPEYFGALGVSLLEGRLFTPADTAGAPPVALVSRSWAQHYFPDGTAIGRRLIAGGCTSCPPTLVVGIVGDVKYLGLNRPSEAVYEPLTAGWYRALVLFVRSAAAPTQVLDPVRTVLRSVDADIPLDDAAPMVDRLSGSIAQPRHWTLLLGGFAAMAVLLAVVGIFGVLSYTVRTRRREIGVRMALGAEHQAVIGMIVGRGMRLALAGTLVGFTVTLAGTRSLATSLFQLSPNDPATLLGVTALLLLAAFIACLIPARRAASVNPVDAIRAE